MSLKKNITLTRTEPRDKIISASLSILQINGPFLLTSSRSRPVGAVFYLTTGSSGTRVSLVRSLTLLLASSNGLTTLGTSSGISRLTTTLT